MPRKREAYIEDILESIERIQIYVEGLSLEDFAEDQKTVDATVNNLENIGEAVKNIPEDFKSRNENVSWEEIAGFRDVLVHQYFRADKEIVWDIVENELPVLKRQLEKSKS